MTIFQGYRNRGIKHTRQKKQEGNGPLDSRAIGMISDCKIDLIIEISNLNYPDIHVHIVFLMASEAMVAPKQPQ